MRRLMRGERGQAIVETALILPIVGLLVLGVLDAGRVFSTWIVVTNSSREGARIAATGQALGIIEARIESAMDGLGSYSYSVVGAQGPTGSPVTVTVEADIDLVTPLISNIFGSTVTLENSAVMRLE